MTELAALLDRLDDVREVKDGREYWALCPCHDDHDPSLHVEVKNGKLLVYCQSCGVSLTDVLVALDGSHNGKASTPNVRVRRLRTQANASQAGTFEASYAYRGDDGRHYVKRRVGRGDSKRIWWDPAPPDDVRLSLYGDPGTEGEVFYTDGEVDVDALLARGVNAVTAGGSDSFQPHHVDDLRGRDVAIWVDRDPAGARSALKVAQLLAGVVASLRFVESHAGKDADDHLSAGFAVEDAREAHYLAVPRLRIVEPERGGDAIFSAPASVQSVWGHGSDCLWAIGEPFMLCGPQGVGKTTLMQQLVLRRVGVIRDPLLGLPVELDERPVLYIAADRPSQARRSFARMVSDDYRELLNDRLRFWKGPPPYDAGKEPDAFADWVLAQECGTVVVDSLKDIATDLSKDETGSRVNIALQKIVANDVDVGSLHHQRKASAENKKPTSLSDVYGSTWLTSGHGSVVLLWGAPGDLVVELSHLKQPAEVVGPLEIVHDHDAGDSRALVDGVDFRIHFKRGERVTVREAAERLFHKDDLSPNEIEQARRKLKRLVREGKATVEQGTNPGTPEKIYVIDDARDLTGGES